MAAPHPSHIYYGAVVYAHMCEEFNFYPLSETFVEERSKRSDGLANRKGLSCKELPYHLPYHGCPPLAADNAKFPQHNFVVFLPGGFELTLVNVYNHSVLYYRS